MAGSEVKTCAVLLDIEGTTTPISFVQDVLFPYARLHGREFILNHLEDIEIQAALRQLQLENADDGSPGAPAIRQHSVTALEDTIGYYLWLIDQDRKSTPLKAIQGRIWQDGYTRGELRSTIYADVRPAFERWHKQGRRIAIYSSGSALAQELLFRHSCSGDLTTYISAYFDTRVGNKKEAESYRRIAWNLNLSAAQILFVSDTINELDAARAAGMKTAMSVRPGGSSRTKQNTHPVIESFDDLLTCEQFCL